MGITKEEMEARERLYTEQIEPLIDRIQALCEEHDIPFLFAVQLYIDPERGVRLSVQQMLTPASAKQFLIAAKILRGELSLLSLEHGDSETLDRIRGQAVESLKEHAAHCEECQKEMERREALGEDISDIQVLSEIMDGHMPEEEPLSDAELSIFNKTKKPKLLH